MTKAVFLDFYNTLVRFDPPREELQVRACREHGLEVDRESIRRSYWKADDLMSRENARQPIATRSEEEKAAFWAQYEDTLLRVAGVEATAEQAYQIFMRIRKFDRAMVLFDDVLPTLAQLKERDLVLGLISNLTQPLEPMCTNLGILPYLDFCLASCEVGSEKPHSPIFRAALERARVEPHQALHVGDQPQADVCGALAVGIRPLLLDRDGFVDFDGDCPRIRTLAEIVDHL